jgi:stalled ribosome alternative rescue factor ArfA
MNKKANKMDSETLQQFLAFRKRAYSVPQKKGKGSYNRQQFKKGDD